MTAIDFPISSGATSPWQAELARFRSYEPRFFDLAVLIIIAAIPTLFAAAVEARTFLGLNVWDKPLKFDFALAVYLLTLVWFARYMPAATRSSRRYRIYSSVVVVAIVLELMWIYGAAGMGTASHFNTSGLGAVIYPMMGVAAVLLTSVSAVYAVSIGRNAGTGLAAPVREGLVLGLALVLPLTLMTAGTLAQGAGHFVGTPADPAGLAFFGWARDVGDLRVSHFFATHAMHAVPLFPLVYAWLGGASRWPVRLFALAFTGLVVFTFVQALMGEPFLPWLG